MLCEIINPSDPYFLETDDFTAAGVAIALVGGGKLALKCEETSEDTPVLFGWDEWFKEKGIDDIGAYFESKENLIKMADALDSVTIGSKRERETFLEAMKFIDDPAKREAYRDEYQERNRTSLSQIGESCYSHAKRFREKANSLS